MKNGNEEPFFFLTQEELEFILNVLLKNYLRDNGNINIIAVYLTSKLAHELETDWVKPKAKVLNKPKDKMIDCKWCKVTHLRGHHIKDF